MRTPATDEASRRAHCRSVVLVQTNASDAVLHGGRNGASRRTDFWEMERVLGADILDHAGVDNDRVGRLVRRLLHYPAALAVVAFRRRRRYDVFWCLSEVDGLILALLFKIVRFRRPILMIGIEASSSKATFLLRRLGLQHYVSALLTTSTPQTEHLVTRLGLPAEKVFVLPYQVDTEFFDTARAAAPRDRTRPYIVAAGLESRDYDSLVEAARTLKVDVVIAAASHWSGRPERFSLDALPPNVTVTSADYEGLRDLYAGASLVVAPLHEAEYQHGITSIQEAMAMRKAVIVTRTLGQGDAVADRRRVLRTIPSRSTAGTFARLFVPDDVDLHGPTGLYVRPNDPEELGRAIQYLLDHPDVAAEMGERGRRVAETVLSLDQFVARVERLTIAAAEARPLSFDAMLGD